MSDAHVSDDDDDSLLSHTPPKAKKASAPKRAGSKPLADVENESFGGEGAPEGLSKNANASEKYQKVSQRKRACYREFKSDDRHSAYTT